MRSVYQIAIFSMAIALSSCQPAQQHAADARAGQDGDRLTVGTVQREIRVGMSGAEVAQVLGSPNIVTTDEQRRESWVYDKISTERVYSQSSGGAGFIPALIIAGGSSAGASSTSQRTFTVIIKFDADRKVRDYAYHTSRF